MCEEIKQELKKYIKPIISGFSKFYGYENNSIEIYNNFFTEPVKCIFSWIEDDWQGTIVCVYTYKNYYVYLRGDFGSCSGCDYFEGSSEVEIADKLLKIFENIKIYKPENFIKIKENFTEYTHPDLIKKWDSFTQNFISTNKSEN